MLGILGMYGLVPFTCSSNAVLTFSDLKIEHSTRYANHDVIGQKPVHEHVGLSLNTVSFKIQLRQYHNSTPAVYVSMLQTMIDSGNAYPLLLGPDYFGRYVIKSFSEERKHFNGLGVAIATDVTLSLEEDSSFNIVSTISNLLWGQ